MKTRSLGKVIVVVGALALQMGCAKDSRMPWWGGHEEAHRAVEAYGTNLRWGRINEAASFVYPENQAAFRQLLAGREDRLRITEFEITSIELREDRQSGEAVVHYRVYRMPSVTEESRTERFGLKYDGMSDRWYVEPNLQTLAAYLGLNPGSR
jgi:hypothetical protein